MQPELQRVLMCVRVVRLLGVCRKLSLSSLLLLLRLLRLMWGKVVRVLLLLLLHL